jgi:hypothetical protein
MEIVKAPNAYVIEDKFTIFLGGSIEMGKAINWQEYAEKSLASVDNLLILNPRRDDWDDSWIQDPTPGTQFEQQVSWELTAQEVSDIIIYNFIPGTISPITLFELGLFSGRPIRVCCPKSFSRYGNVKVVCDRYSIPVYENFDDLIDDIKDMLGTFK